MENKVVIITGGAGGIGAAGAKLFAERGAYVVVADYEVTAGEKVVFSLNERTGKQHLFAPVDVTNSESVNEMVDKVLATYGTIDVLINNAGITRDAMFRKMTDEMWHDVIDVNLNGLFYCTKAVLPTMLEKGAGVIINTSSIVGIKGNIGQTNYAATKSAVIGMTKTWAKELGRKGIRVNAVAPGFIETNMVKTIPEKIVHQLKEQVPLNRLGQPEEIGKAYVFLASDDASYINGAVLEVTGGL